jgi:hypothetical protein
MSGAATSIFEITKSLGEVAAGHIKRLPEPGVSEKALPEFVNIILDRFGSGGAL